MPVIGRRALPNTWKPKETGIDARTPPKGAVRAGYPLLFLLQRETAQLNARLRYRWLPKDIPVPPPERRWPAPQPHSLAQWQAAYIAQRDVAIANARLRNRWNPKTPGIDARLPPRATQRQGAAPLLFLLQRETAQLNARLRYRWLPKITQAAQPRSFPNRKPAMRAPAPWRYRGRANLSVRRFYIAGRTLSLLNRSFTVTLNSRTSNLRLATRDSTLTLQDEQ